MNHQLIVPFMIALAVGLCGWSAARLVIGQESRRKTRLQERLRAGQGQEQSHRPLMAALQKADYLPRLLADNAAVVHFREGLRYAYPDLSLWRFLMMVAMMTSVVGIGVYLATHLVGAAGVAALAAMILPFLVINSKRNRRQRLLIQQLTDALGFLARILRAGHSLSTGMRMMGEELPEPIAAEFRRCNDQHSLGRSLEEALTDMIPRVDSTDFAFFITSVLIQRQTGGDLAEILDNIADTVRNRIRLQERVRVLTAEGRATGAILTALPPVCFAGTYVLNPEYAGVLLFTHAGRLALGGVLILQVIGLLIIRRIVELKV